MNRRRPVQLRITLDKKTAVLGLAALLVCTVVYRVVSDTLTFTTYYPSPFGVYGKLYSTKQTILARDSGAVGIGTSSPAAGFKLHVEGGYAAFNNYGAAKFGAVTVAGTGDTAQYSAVNLATDDPAAPGKGTWGLQYRKDTGNLSLGNYGTGLYPMHLTQGGRVGIGMTGPSQKLDVAGQIHASEDICTDAGGGKCLSTAGAGTCPGETLDTGTSCVDNASTAIVTGQPDLGAFAGTRVGAALACKNAGKRIARIEELAALCIGGITPSGPRFWLSDAKSTADGCSVDLITGSNSWVYVLCAKDK